MHCKQVVVLLCESDLLTVLVAPPPPQKKCIGSCHITLSVIHCGTVARALVHVIRRQWVIGNPMSVSLDTGVVNG